MLTIVVGGRIAGLIQYAEELEPKYRHASIDIFVDPALHGRGIGTEAIRLLVRHLIEDRGHHRITIDPAADNAEAIRAYEKAGFTPRRRHARVRARHGHRRVARRSADGAAWGRRRAAAPPELYGVGFSVISALPVSAPSPSAPGPGSVYAATNTARELSCVGSWPARPRSRTSPCSRSCL